MIVSYSQIGEKDVSTEVRSKVLGFFDSNGVSLGRFFEMHSGSRDEDGQPFTEETIVELVKKTRYEFFVAMSSWSSSEEGIEYWTDISDSWEEFYSWLHEEYRDFLSDSAKSKPKQVFYKINGVVKPREDMIA